LALESSGLHTNGFSLARKVLFESLGLEPNARPSELEGKSVAEALLAVHRSYYALLWPLLEQNRLCALAHITGGGLVDNVPRVLGSCDAWIDRSSWRPPALFRYLCERGQVGADEAYQVFNMGIGMVLFVEASEEASVRAHLEAQGERVHRLGHTEAARGPEGVVRWLS
jgi:phosphoribosylformylglycinamidine cyclo-ligase